MIACRRSPSGFWTAVAGQDRFDLIAALGYPLPVTVIAEMLGVPAGGHGQVRGLVQ